MTSDQREIIHLLNRATFGPSSVDIEYFLTLSKEDVVEKLFSDSEFYVDLDTVPKNEVEFLPKRGLSFKERLKRRRVSRDYKQKLNFDWLNQLVFSPAQLRERMAFFWHDHFACNVDNAMMHQKQINTIRKHSLEYFGDLVINIAKDPGMILYLNGNKNVKDNPNENFGRELLELFTIGIGNYTEADIQEASRAFTGYRFKRDGTFYIDTKLQDKGLKNFMGDEAYFTGEDIMNLIFKNPQTGHYIIGKIYFYLLGEEISPALLKSLGASFYKSGYHIGTLVKEILLSEEFYAMKYRGSKIKSPIELMANVMRITQLKFSNPSVALNIQRKLGQALFYPPNVSGWVYGKNWIDLAGLAERINLTRNFLSKNKTKTEVKKQITQEDLDIQIDPSESITKMEHDLAALTKHAYKISDRRVGSALANILYTVPHSHLKPLLSKQNKRLASDQGNFKNVLITLMSQPEYQVC